MTPAYVLGEVVALVASIGTEGTDELRRLPTLEALMTTQGGSHSINPTTSTHVRVA